MPGLVLEGGTFRPVNIAVTTFSGDPQQGPALTGVITDNFRRSVYLNPLDPRTFTDRNPNPDSVVSLNVTAIWRAN